MRRIDSLLMPAIVGLALMCLPASAEEAAKPAALTLSECIEIAMRNQTDVLTAANNVTIARSRLSQNTSGYLPQVSVQNNAFTIGQQGVLSQFSTGTAVNITQNIFDGGLREANVQGARYGVRQNSAAFDRTRQTVTFNVTTAYYQALRAKRLAEVAESNVKYNETLRDQIQAQAKEGESAEADVLPVLAQLANARVDMLSAQNSVRTAAISLQSAMGVRSQPGFDVREVEKPPDIVVGPLDQYIASAAKNRPDVIESEAGLGAARALVRAARVSLYPRPVISGDYQRSISGGFRQEGTQVVGGIAFNLFDGGASRAAYREAKAGQANAVQYLRQTDRDIRAQVEEAYLNLTNAKERLAASQAGLDAARKNLEAQQERYKVGLAITLDLLNAEVQLVTAESNLVQARYDYYNAIAQMDYAVGGQGGFNGKQDKQST